MNALIRGVVLVALVVTAIGCSTQQADRLYLEGNSAEAIASYEQYLQRRAELSADDAGIVLRLAIALADRESTGYDPNRSEHYLQLLVNLFPKTPEARQAAFALDSMRTVEELKLALRARDSQIQALRTVLDSVVAAENRLRSEVETKDEEREGLEGRIAVLTRSARRLTSEIAQLEEELEALKRIDLETLGGVAEVESPESDSPPR